MKHYNLIAIAALLALAGSPAGAQVQNPGEGQVAYRPDGTPVILPPEHGAVILPEISTGTARPIADAYVTVSLVDGADKPFYPPQILGWREGLWKDKNGKASPRVLFPLRDRLDTNDPKFRYKLEYKVRYLRGGEETALDYMPLLSGRNFWLPAAAPFSWLNIDAGKLQWAEDAAAGGLRTVQWTINRKSGGKAKPKMTGIFSLKGPADSGAWISKDDEVTAEIVFTCVVNSLASKIPWADNGKDPRKLPSGLDIVLAQPACPK